jgi:hypothetical protein
MPYLSFLLVLRLAVIPAAADYRHDPAPAVASRALPLFDNLGTHHHAITTTSLRAL